jgi:hypothetical protein
MNYSFSYLFPFLKQPKISNDPDDTMIENEMIVKSTSKQSPKLSLIHPSTFPEYKEERLSEDSDTDKIISCIVILSPIPTDLSNTSFRTTYDYHSVVNIISKKLRKLKCIFDKSKHFWLLEVNSIVLRISIFGLNNVRVIEVYSLNKNADFWKIYVKLKEKLNNIQDKNNTWMLENTLTKFTSVI